MAYNKKQFERFAMTAEQLTQESFAKKAGGWVQIEEIGNKLGIERQDAHAFAQYLADLEYAKVQFGMPPILILTPKGHDKIAEFRLSPLRRWWINHKDKIIAGIIGGLIVLIVGKIISAIAGF